MTASLAASLPLSSPDLRRHAWRDPSTGARLLSEMSPGRLRHIARQIGVKRIKKPPARATRDPRAVIQLAEDIGRSVINVRLAKIKKAVI